MANPMFGQEKFNALVDEAAKNLKQEYNFGTLPVIVDAEHTENQVPDGTAGNKVKHLYADGLDLTACYIGTQTIDNPQANTSGIDYSYDQTDNEGVAWVMGDEAVKGREGIDRFTVGSQAFSASLKLSIADVSGTDDCAFGFRKVEAHQAAIDDFDEMACLNVISGNVTIETILNNGATTSTDTTSDVADAGVVTLKVNVAKTGAVTYEIDGQAPSTTAAFSFDIGEVVTPFFYFLHASDVAGAIVLQKLVVESDEGSKEQ